MSKERARRREVREREAAVRVAARAEEQARLERRTARRAALTSGLTSGLTSRLPSSRRRSRPTGVLAARRRRQVLTTAALLVALNVAVWVAFPAWAPRTLALMVSLLAAPVLHTLLFRRTR